MTAADSAMTGTPLGTGTDPAGAPWRTTAALARIEALFLTRNPLVLAGLVGGVAAVGAWFWLNPVQPLWWWADWRIGAGQLLLAVAVLVAAQLAAGRSRRDGLTDLYRSFPTTAGTRAAAHLAGLAGALPAGLVLAGAGVLLVQLRGPVGRPSMTVLAAGVVLVLAAGAAGAAIGTRFPHPLAGLLGALALFLATAIGRALPGWTVWLIPWHYYPDQLGSMPGRLAGYPPAGAHVAYLVSGAALAAVITLALTSRKARIRALLTAAGAVAAAALCLTGVLQVQPVPGAELNRLAAETANPASAQRCTAVSEVRYCVFPGFGQDLSQIEAPVNDVLALLPARPGPLTVEQDVSIDFNDPFLTYGYSNQQTERWDAAERAAPGNTAAASLIGLTVGQWPAKGDLADADFQVALSTAAWAVRFPPASWTSQCVPLDQAREAVTIWLAILATHPPAARLQHSLTWSETSAWPEKVGSALITGWGYPYADQLTTPGPQFTAAGYLLAAAMARLPAARVRRVLSDSWASWLNPRSTDAQLAAALGIALPKAPAPVQSPGLPNQPVPVCRS